MARFLNPLKPSLSPPKCSVPCRCAGRSEVGVNRSKIVTPKKLRIAEWDGSPSQVKAFEALKERMAESPYSFDDETIKWYLRDRYFDPIEAEEKLIKTAKWRKKLNLENLNEEEVAEEMKTGKIRVYEHPDVLGRPVILMDTSKHIIGQFPVESTQKLCALVVKQALEKMPPGTETLLTINDLRQFGRPNADLQFIKYTIDLLFWYNPRRLGQSLLVEPPWIFQPVWQVARPLLKKYSALVRFAKASEVREEYFTEETCPPQFKL